MGRPISCRLNILLKVVLVVSVLGQHSLPGLRMSEAVAAAPSPPQNTDTSDRTDGTDWLNTDEVEITLLSVPEYVRKGEEAELECQWSPSKNIYSLKWYFNGNQFFSYNPEVDPTVVTIPADGFKVNTSLTSSTGEKITLSEIGMAATGSYKCEVTMEAGFVTADKSGNMTVVVVPEEKPRITGTKHQYRINDEADLTCSSAPSIPVADLTWFINNEKAPTKYLIPIKSTRHPGGLEEAHKGLRFSVSRKHFRGGEMTLRCTASIKPLYTKTQQHSVDGLLTYNIPVLSSLEKSAVPGRAGGGGGRLVGVAVVVGALVVVEMVGAVLLSTTISPTR